MQRCWEAKRKARKNRVRMKVRAWSHYITVHTHAHTLVHMCIHMHTWVHSCTHMLTLIYMHTHAHISTDPHTMHIHYTCIYVHVNIGSHAHICTCMYMYMHFWSHTHIYMQGCNPRDLTTFLSSFFHQIFLRVFVMNTGQNLSPRPMCTVPVGLLSHSCSGTLFSSARNKPRTSCMLYKALYHWTTSPVLPTLLELKINWIWEINFLLKYHNI